MPRITKLTPALQAQVVTYLRAGNYVETAAAAAGVSKTTLYDWLKRGARGEGAEFVEFADAVTQALAQAEARDVAIIAKAAATEWQAAAWRLERMRPARWGRRNAARDRTERLARQKLRAEIAALAKGDGSGTVRVVLEYEPPEDPAGGDADAGAAPDRGGD